MFTSVFVITKPLQLMVTMLIIDQLSINQSVDLVIVDSFGDAENVYFNLKKISKPRFYDSIHFYSNHSDAYRYINRSKHKFIYIDSDVGLKKYFSLLCLKTFKPFSKIIVYEEGVGSYRNNLYLSTIKKKIFKFFGVGAYFGGSIFTSSIYLFNPSLYIETVEFGKSKVKKINKSIGDLLKEQINLLHVIFKYKQIEKNIIKSKLCHIYLTSWKPNILFIRRFKEFAGDKFIKPHPHLKRNLQCADLIEINAGIPAEILMNDLSEKYTEIFVYHHGTSSMLYLDKPNVKFIKI